MSNKNAIRCRECGGNACICTDEIGWAAHCMDCDNSTSRKRGYYDPRHRDEKEAVDAWNKLNEVQQ